MPDLAVMAINSKPQTSVQTRFALRPVNGRWSGWVAIALAVTFGAMLNPAASAQTASPGGGQSVVGASNEPVKSPRPASRPHTMSTEELALDCAKLTGRIRVRIRQLRAAMGDGRTSLLSRSLQAAATPIVGGTSRGIDPSADLAQELGQVEAYNAKLREKNCPAYDLDAEFAPGNTAPPRPIRPAKAAK